MQKRTYITPIFRIREVQLTLLETMSGNNQGWGDMGAKSLYNRKKIDDDDFYYDEYMDFDNIENEDNL